MTMISRIGTFCLSAAAVAGRLVGKELTAGVAAGDGIASDQGSEAPVGAKPVFGSMTGGVTGFAAR